MNETIMNLANRLSYNNQMTCNSDQLKLAYLNLPTINLKNYIKTIPVQARAMWLMFAASKKIIRSVVFLDTSKISGYDCFENNSIKNEMEIRIVAECLKIYIKVTPAEFFYVYFPNPNQCIMVFC